MTLDPICTEHLEMMRGWRNQPSIMQWCRQTRPISDVEQDAWFYRYTKDQTQNLFIINSVNHGPVGVGGLTSIDMLNSRAEFSLYIAPIYQHHGYGAIALDLIFKYGFGTLNLNQIWGETFANNPALEMFLKMGMKQDGIRRDFYYKNGKYLDAILVSKLRDDK